MSKESSQNEFFYYQKRAQTKDTLGYQHYHNYFEIYFLEDGKCHYFIDNDTYDVKAGDILLIPPGIIHKTTYSGNATRRLIQCDERYIPASVRGTLNSMLYTYRNDELTERIRGFFDVIEREYEAPDTFSRDALINYTHLFCYTLARTASTKPPRKTGAPATTQTIAYIKEHFSSDISLGELAKGCSVSPEHLSRVFKRDTGFGISEYLSIIRLQHAQVMLVRARTLSIIEVAHRCGFNDSNYFSTKFKRMYGISPLKFRQTHKSN